MRNSITLEQIVDYLNDLVKRDPVTINNLFVKQFPCNESLVNHPTIQVRSYMNDYYVSILEIINGMFGLSESYFGPIVALYDEETHIKGFRLSKRFDIDYDVVVAQICEEEDKQIVSELIKSVKK